MKNIILILLVACLSFSLSAQITAHAYMNRAPGIPDNLCKTKSGEQNAFLTAVKDLASAINEDAQNRNREAEEFMRANEQQMHDNMIKKSGLSDEEIKRLQNGKELTDAETEEMANKMLLQKANISLSEAKNFENMSEEGQEAWAQGYAAEQMALAQANPMQIKDIDQSSRLQFELLSEQSTIQNNVSAKETKLQQTYLLLDNDAKAAKAVLEKELKPLYDELNSINDGEGSTQADVDHANRVIKQIHAKQDLYCERFTPRMLEFLGECKVAYTSSIPDYDRLEQIQFEITSAQTGIPLMTAGKGLLSIRAVEEYLKYLEKAYSYKLYSPDE